MFTQVCSQEGITLATPTDTLLEAPQNPPRFIQDLLYPYVRSKANWFCPGVGRERHYVDAPQAPTLAYNGTSYLWNFT